jgi:hypothetical protein
MFAEDVKLHYIIPKTNSIHIADGRVSMMRYRVRLNEFLIPTVEEQKSFVHPAMDIWVMCSSENTSHQKTQDTA